MKSRLVSACLTLGLIMASSLTAQAGVIYNWQEIGASDGGVSYTGQLEITEQAYASGRFSAATFDSPCAACYVPLSTDDSPVMAFTMRFAPAALTFAADVVFDTPFTFEIYAFDLAVRGSGLTGDIFANDTGSDIAMSSNGAGLWTIGQSNTDAGGLCIFTNSPECRGATGRWVLDRATVQGLVPVPEPVPLTIIIVTMLALGLSRRQNTSL